MRPVAQYTLDGTLLAIYPSVEAAASVLAPNIEARRGAAYWIRAAVEDGKPTCQYLWRAQRAS